MTLFPQWRIISGWTASDVPIRRSAGIYGDLPEMVSGARSVVFGRQSRSPMTAAGISYHFMVKMKSREVSGASSMVRKTGSTVEKVPASQKITP